VRTLVLKTENGELPLEDVILFGSEAVKNGRKRGDKVAVDWLTDGELQFSIQVNDPKPDPEPVKKIKRTITPKSVKEEKERKERAAKQIEEHRKLPPEERPGYVPPVEGTPKQRKHKCPVCNWKKPVVTISGIKVIKPHVRNGEECPGGSTQV
jgi:hypothetical protein